MTCLRESARACPAFKSMTMLLLAASLATVDAVHAVTITNPSFEAGSAIFGPPNVTDWRQDGHAFVSAENGITPPAGSKMLKFLSTSYASASMIQYTAASDSDVTQILDLTGTNDQAVIATGSGTIGVTAAFNRVVGSVVDTQFLITMHSYSVFPAVGTNPTANSSATIFTDSNLATWENLTAILALPVNTQYVTLRLIAREDVVNDPGFPEFHGQYADAIGVSLVPEPGTWAMFGVGLAGLSLWARRRSGQAQQPSNAELLPVSESR